MADCGEKCGYRQSFEVGRRIVIRLGAEIFEPSRLASKLRELQVIEAAFDSVPDEPSCESLRKEDESTLRCPKAYIVNDAVRVVLGNPDMPLKGNAHGPAGFTAILSGQSNGGDK